MYFYDLLLPPFFPLGSGPLHVNLGIIINDPLQGMMKKRKNLQDSHTTSKNKFYTETEYNFLMNE